MRERIPLTEEMIIELLQLQDEGKGLRPMGNHFGVSHATIKRWLESDEVATYVSSTRFKGFARGDSIRLTRDVQTGAYDLKAGDTVIFDEFEPGRNTAWVLSDRVRGDAVIDIPMNALEKVAK